MEHSAQPAGKALLQVPPLIKQKLVEQLVHAYDVKLHVAQFGGEVALQTPFDYIQFPVKQDVQAYVV